MTAELALKPPASVAARTAAVVLLGFAAALLPILFILLELGFTSSQRDVRIGAFVLIAVAAGLIYVAVRFALRLWQRRASAIAQQYPRVRARPSAARMEPRAPRKPHLWLGFAAISGAAAVAAGGFFALVWQDNSKSIVTVALFFVVVPLAAMNNIMRTGRRHHRSAEAAELTNRRLFERHWGSDVWIVFLSLGFATLLGVPLGVLLLWASALGGLTSESLLIGAAGAMALGFAAFGQAVCFRLFRDRNEPLYRVDDDGVHVLGGNPKSIPWSDIVGVGRFAMKGRTIVTLELRHPERHIRWIDRLITKDLWMGTGIMTEPWTELVGAIKDHPKYGGAA